MYRGKRGKKKKRKKKVISFIISDSDLMLLNVTNITKPSLHHLPVGHETVALSSGCCR